MERRDTRAARPRRPGWLLAAALLAASFLCLRLAWADHLSRGGADDRRRASQLVPQSPAVWRRLAERVEAGGGDPRPALERVTSLDPDDAGGWMAAGLSAEQAGDRRAAETRLLRAASVSRLYQPAWTLAQFYYRSGQADAFWPWVRAALERAYDDPKPLWPLCWSLRPDAGWILDTVVPGRRLVQRSYLIYLLDRREDATADRLAARLAGGAERDPTDRATLLAYCDRRLTPGAMGRAVAVWNAMATRGVVPAPAGSGHLVNGDFSSEPLGGGFDWRLEPAAGVSYSRSAAGLRIALSGRQPDRCRLLSQWMGLDAGRGYRFVWRLESPTGAPVGLGWRVSASDGSEIATGRGGEELRFTALPGLARLELVHERPPGQAPWEGAALLRDLRLEVLP
jgi:hypothetical protein